MRSENKSSVESHSHSDDEPLQGQLESAEPEEAPLFMGWIREEQKKAQESIDHGEFREASEQLKSLLTKLAPLGPKNHPQLKSELEYALDDVSARSLLEDLRGTVKSVEAIDSDCLNVWSPEEAQKQLDSLSDEGNALADKAEFLGNRTSSEQIMDEARLLRDELRNKVERAKTEIKKRIGF